MASLTLTGDTAIRYHLENPDNSYLEYEPSRSNPDLGTWRVYPKTSRPIESGFFKSLFTPKKEAEFKTFILREKQITVSSKTDLLDVLKIERKVADIARSLNPDGFDMIEEDSAMGPSVEFTDLKTAHTKLESLYLEIDALSDRRFPRLGDHRKFEELEIAVENLSKELLESEIIYDPTNTNDQATFDLVRVKLEKLPKFLDRVKGQYAEMESQYKERSSRDFARGVEDQQRGLEAVLTAARQRRDQQEEAFAEAALATCSPVVEDIEVESLITQMTGLIIQEKAEIARRLEDINHLIRADVERVTRFELPNFRELPCDLYDDTKDLQNLSESLEDCRETTESFTAFNQQIHQDIKHFRAEAEKVRDQLAKDQFLNDEELQQALTQLDENMRVLQEQQAHFIQRMHHCTQSHPYFSIQRRNHLRSELLDHASSAIACYQKGVFRTPMLCFRNGALNVENKPFSTKTIEIPYKGKIIHVESESFEQVRGLLSLSGACDFRHEIRGLDKLLALEGRIDNTNEPLEEKKAAFRSSLDRLFS